MPVVDMERAMKFYETVFDLKLERHEMGELDMAWFPGVHGSIGAAGSLVKHPQFYKPSADGVLVYFTAFSGNVDTELGRVEAAGGKVLLPRREISPEYGYMAVAMDTEGNRFAIHSRT